MPRPLADPERQALAKLIARGKPKKVALTACRRKLLTILDAILRPAQSCPASA